MLLDNLRKSCAFSPGGQRRYYGICRGFWRTFYAVLRRVFLVVLGGGYGRFAGAIRSRWIRVFCSRSIAFVRSDVHAVLGGKVVSGRVVFG